ncbi:ABC transporter substrate-binding protein [Patescibacteria group bacterium]
MNKTTQVILGIIIVVVVVALIVYGVTKADQAATPDSTEPIKIGWLGPLTGDVSSIGQNAKAATEIAVAEINEAGGINGRPIKVIYEDSSCDGKAAANAASKLLNIDQVSIIWGGACSGETSAFVKSAMEQKKIVMTYCSSAPNLSQSGEFFFRVYPSDNFQAKFAAEFAYNSLGKRKAAILYTQSDWGTGLKQVFEKKFPELGGEIVKVESMQQKDKDMRTQLTKIKEANPDLLYMPAYTEETKNAVRQVHELGLDLQVLGGDAWDDPSIWEDAGLAGEGVMYTIPYSPISDHYKQAMKDKTGSDDILICAPGAYDVPYLTTQAMKAVGTDPEKIKDYLHSMPAYTNGVVTSSIEFDANGDIKEANYMVKIIKDSKMVEYTK